jgi:hypothetical protein
MPTQAASMTILGVGDAATLPLVPGRMMAMAGSLKWQLQTPLISTDEITYSIQKAMTWPDRHMSAEAAKMTLPEAGGSVGFGQDDLLALVMDKYHGRMVYKDLWGYLQPTGLITNAPMRKLIKAIQEDSPFMYEGVRYEWVKKPGGHMEAEEVEADEEEAEEEAEPV